MKLTNIIKNVALAGAGAIVGAKVSPVIRALAGTKAGKGAAVVSKKVGNFIGNLNLTQVPILEIADEGIEKALDVPGAMKVVDKANTILQTPAAWARVYLNPRPIAKVIYNVEKWRTKAGSVGNGLAAAIGLENIARIAESENSAYQKQLDKFAKERGIN